MVLDCKWSDGNATFLFDNYKYIIVFIHCCIISTFIEWRGVIRLMDECTAAVWGFFRINGYLMLYRYNNRNCENKKSIKK